MAANNTTTTPQTVKFNVGGKLFETARSLIDQHENTMLAKICSDRWLEDPNAVVFIDRDGDMFAQVLNYLRYGTISLPITINLDMFLRDLDYYGITPDEGSVLEHDKGWSTEVADRCQKIRKLEEDKDKIEAEINSLELENDIDILSNFCASEYLRRKLKPISPVARQMSTHPTTWVQITRPNGSDASEKGNKDKEKLYATACAVCSQEKNREMFRKSISRFGLRLHVFASSNGQVKLSLGSF